MEQRKSLSLKDSYRWDCYTQIWISILRMKYIHQIENSKCPASCNCHKVDTRWWRIFVRHQGRFSFRRSWIIEKFLPIKQPQREVYSGIKTYPWMLTLIFEVSRIIQSARWTAAATTGYMNSKSQGIWNAGNPSGRRSSNKPAGTQMRTRNLFLVDGRIKEMRKKSTRLQSPIAPSGNKQNGSWWDGDIHSLYEEIETQEAGKKRKGRAQKGSKFFSCYFKWFGFLRTIELSC